MPQTESITDVSKLTPKQGTMFSWKGNVSINGDAPAYRVRYLGWAFAHSPSGHGCTKKPVSGIIESTNVDEKRLDRLSIAVSKYGLDVEFLDGMHSNDVYRFDIKYISYCSVNSEISSRIFSWLYKKPDAKLVCHAVLCVNKTETRLLAMDLYRAFHIAYDEWKIRGAVKMQMRRPIESPRSPGSECGVSTSTQTTWTSPPSQDLPNGDIRLEQRKLTQRCQRNALREFHARSDGPAQPTKHTTITRTKDGVQVVSVASQVESDTTSVHMDSYDDLPDFDQRTYNGFRAAVYCPDRYSNDVLDADDAYYPTIEKYRPRDTVATDDESIVEVEKVHVVSVQVEPRHQAVAEPVIVAQKAQKKELDLHEIELPEEITKPVRLEQAELIPIPKPCMALWTGLDVPSHYEKHSDTNSAASSVFKRAKTPIEFELESSQSSKGLSICNEIPFPEVDFPEETTEEKIARYVDHQMPSNGEDLDFPSMASEQPYVDEFIDVRL